MQRAAELGFDINGALNGWCLPAEVTEAQKTGKPLHRGRHVSGSGNYFACVTSLLRGLERDYSTDPDDCTLCSKAAKVMSKIRDALANHQIWLQHNDPNKGTTWNCPAYP